MKSNFVDDCLKDPATIDKIDDYIDKWHLGDGNDKSLYEYLGLTQKEYATWVINPNSLNLIIEGRKILEY